MRDLNSACDRCGSWFVNEHNQRRSRLAYLGDYAGHHGFELGSP